MKTSRLTMWQKWIERTRKRANAEAERDRILFGNGFIIKHWWGYKRVNPFDVYMLR